MVGTDDWQAGRPECLTPFPSKHRRHDHRRISTPRNRFADETNADVGLPHPDAVGNDDTAVPAEYEPGAGDPLQLQVRKGRATDWVMRRAIRFDNGVRENVPGGLRRYTVEVQSWRSRVAVTAASASWAPAQTAS